MKFILKTILDDNGKEKFAIERKGSIYYYLAKDETGNTKAMPTNWVKENINNIINAGLSGNNLYVKKVEKSEIKKRKSMGSKIDYSKLKPLGMYRLDASMSTPNFNTYGGVFLFLMEYGKDLVYMHNMLPEKLAKYNPELANIIDQWFKTLSVNSNSQHGKTLNYKDIHYKITSNSLPDYTLPENKVIYNIFTYKKKLGYKLQYGTVVDKTKNIRRTGIFLYKEGEPVGYDVEHTDDCNSVWYKGSNGLMTVVNMQQNTTMVLSAVDEIQEVGENYIVGVKTDRNGEYYYYKVIRRKDNKLVYTDTENSKHYDNGTSYSGEYAIIADRYLVISSYTNGVLDLETERKIKPPILNVLTNFICNFDGKEYTDRYGRHPVSELPDLNWTGYSIEESIRKFNGFIPNRKRTGNISLINTGCCNTYDNDILMFKGLDNGLFYYTNSNQNEVANVFTNEIIELDKVMKTWVNRLDTVSIFNKKPDNLKNFSILELLKNNKMIYGLQFKYRNLNYNGNDLSTSFLKEKINFNINNIIDIRYKIQRYDATNGPTGKVEIICQVNNKKITFETDMKYKLFEVANIE